MNPTYQHLKTYKTYDIFVRSAGFEQIPNAFGKVISFLVRDSSGTGVSIFAFAYSGLDAIQNPQLNENELISQAISIIEKHIDQNRVTTAQEYTFEYKNGEYSEVENPGWWVKTTPSPSPSPSTEDDS